jgi:hypothetical protein
MFWIGLRSSEMNLINLASILTISDEQYSDGTVYMEVGG